MDDLPTILHISYFDDDKTDLTVEELDLNKPSSLFGLQDWVADLSEIQISSSSNKEKSKAFSRLNEKLGGERDISDRLADRESKKGDIV